MLAEWKFSQKFKISRKTIGRVAAGLCIRNFNIKEWEQPVFFYLFSLAVVVAVQTFSNIETAGGGGAVLILTSPQKYSVPLVTVVWLQCSAVTEWVQCGYNAV